MISVSKLKRGCNLAWMDWINNMHRWNVGCEVYDSLCMNKNEKITKGSDLKLLSHQWENVRWDRMQAINIAALCQWTRLQEPWNHREKRFSGEKSLQMPCGETEGQLQHSGGSRINSNAAKSRWSLFSVPFSQDIFLWPTCQKSKSRDLHMKHPTATAMNPGFLEALQTLGFAATTPGVPKDEALYTSKICSKTRGPWGHGLPTKKFGATIGFHPTRPWAQLVLKHRFKYLLALYEPIPGCLELP